MFYFKCGCFLFLIISSVSASLMKSSADYSSVIDHVEVIVGGDKILHCITAFFLVVFSLWCTPLAHRLWLGNKVGLPTLIVVVAIVIDEISQIWLPRREFSMADLQAGFVGIFLGILVHTIASACWMKTIRCFYNKKSIKRK